MSHRFPTWWRALSVVLLSLATVTWPSAAQATPTAPFALVHQDPFAVLSSRGTSHFNFTLHLARTDVSARVQLSLYPRLVTRSQIGPLVSGAGATGRPGAATSNFALKCTTRHSLTFTVALYTKVLGRAKSPCAVRGARLRLPCRGQTCDGVYPLRYTVTNNGVSTSEWSMIAVQASRVATPLNVDWITTLDPTSWQQSGRAVAVMNALAKFDAVPLTLTADYRTLVRALSDTSATATAWRASLNKALASPLHRASDAPPGDIDFGGLVANGLTTQVGTQLSLASQQLRTLNGRYVDNPVVLSATPSVSSLDALAGAGVSEVVLPEADLALAPSSTLNWGAPFHVQGAGPLLALSTDEPLSQLVTDSTIEPGRRAVLTLTTLAFLHFEEPNAPAIRTVVISAPVAQTPATFMVDLFSGLAHNPFFHASNLAPSFNSILVATNGAPSSRSLVTSRPSTWTSRNLATLTSLIGQVNSFGQAVTSNVVESELHVAVARSEIIGGPDARQLAITRATDALNAQLGDFSIDAGPITLAGPGTSLPITIISRANYTVTAVVHLITDRLVFPKGKNLVVTLNSPTKSLRVATANHQGGSLTLQVVVTTPDSAVVLARAAIQVRIAGTSVVGYLLTIASLLVLALWWWRTYRRRPKGQHAR
jgi:hypothetical protein